MIDSTGATVPVAVSWSGSDMAPIGWPGSGFDGNLLSGAILDLSGGPVDLTFSNIPYAEYNVIAYVDYENPLQNTDLTILDGSGSTVLAGGVNVADGINGDSRSFAFPGDYDDASLDGSGNFVIFEGLTNPNITVRSQNAGSVSYLSGVQIVQVPEPSLFAAVFGVAALGGLALRRRRS
ncbi:MAG: PEP-CTERM sorting domain-containing protein [Verrucomicrobia bacterium]|nr:PEP-CTERM sorting domain-containing protein [Verrucomicrobiota bacterium]